MIELAIYLAFMGTLLWWIIVLAPWQPWKTRESLEPTHNAGVSLNDVTVLIPARNEGPFIEQTLNALSMQGLNSHIIVIDDQSNDDTAKQAQNLGAVVISGTAPPVGWSGRLWALEQGLSKVHTPYTLLLDADITLTPGIVAALLKKAREENLALVSLMAEPPLHNFLERLLMPAFIFFFKLLYPFQLANKPESRAAAGGCILVETRTLQTVGAFANLHDALIDDCALASHVKHSGLRTWIGLSHSARIHRGYDDLSTIWNLVARTAYTQLHYSPFLLFVCTLMMVSMFWFAPLIPLISPFTVMVIVPGILTWIAMTIIYSPISRYYHCSAFWVLALPVVIGTLFLLMTWTSAFRYWRGERAQWKNRRYEISA